MDSSEMPKTKISQTVPLIAHVIYRLDVGGMENGLVNLINRMPPERYRHAVISLTENTEFSQRIHRKGVSYYALQKREGKDPGLYFRLWRVLRILQPDLVHTRNLATVEAVVPAVVAGVRYCVHGEHGRDVQDVDGTNRKYRLLRRMLTPFVHKYIPLSQDLESYLVHHVGVPPVKIKRIPNGVDTETFRPSENGRVLLPAPGFAEDDAVVIGNVGRLQEVKNPLLLVESFKRLCELIPEAGRQLRLVIVGDGPLKPRIEDMLKSLGIDSMTWLPGQRHDVAALLRGLDIFVLPSRVEGISNTILESMASGVPVVATRVGGNAELIDDQVTGLLVPSDDAESMAGAIARYVRDPELRKTHGSAGRLKVEREFSLDRMVDAYLAVYDELLVERQELNVRHSWTV
jgi:sugar transferase (PEP-CTERM/EpsH1 system associated)